MSITVDFNVLNQKGSPALYEDIFANRPAASFTGRIFIATDTGNLYRDTGTTWTQLATSGGASGIDDVLAIQQKFTASRDIDGNNWDFTLFNYKTFKLQNDIAGGETYLHLTGRAITLGDFDSANNRILLSVDDQNQSIQTSGNSGADGLQIDFNASSLNIGFFNQSSTWLNIDGGNAKFLSIVGGQFNGISLDFNQFQFRFGIFTNNFSHTSDFCYICEQNLLNNSNLSGFKNGSNYDFLKHELNGGLGIEIYQFGKLYNGANNKEFCLQIDYTLTEIATYYQDNVNGFRINVVGTYEFGDIGNTASYLIINTSTDTLQTYFNNAQFGLLLDDQNKLSQLGDYNGNGNSTVIVSDDTNAIITLYSNNEIYLNDNGTGNMISGTASGSSGDHLVITINGTQYKINLLNP